MENILHKSAIQSSIFLVWALVIGHLQWKIMKLSLNLQVYTFKIEMSWYFFVFDINYAFLKCWFLNNYWLGTLKFNKLSMLSSWKYLASSRLGSKVFGLQGYSFGIIKFGTKLWLGCWIFYKKNPNSLSDK